MNKTSHKLRALSQHLKRLEPRSLSADELGKVSGGGQTASTSRSGTPEAGDDTVGDSSVGTNTIQILSWSFSASNPGGF